MWNLFYGGRDSSTEISSIILQSFIRWPLSFLWCLTEQCLWSLCTCVYASAYVSACVCIQVHVYFSSFFVCLLNLFVYLCVPAHLFMCCVCIFDTVQPASISFSLVWSCHQRLIHHFFRSFRTVEHFSLWLTSTLTAQQETLSPF